MSEQDNRLEILCDFLIPSICETPDMQPAAVVDAVTQLMAFPYARQVMAEYIAESVRSELSARNRQRGVQATNFGDGIVALKCRTAPVSNDA